MESMEGVMSRQMLLLLAGVAGPVAAAPLDALLTVDVPDVKGRAIVELGLDAMNGTLDVLGVRAKDTEFGGTSVGNYQGQHLKTGIALTPSLWLEGGYWRRQIDYRADTMKLASWQAAVQYRIQPPTATRTGLALRMSLWGNQADTLAKTSATTLPGLPYTLDSVTVSNPNDLQGQIDLIATQKWNQSALSVFMGGGRSRVHVGSIEATAHDGTCHYQIAFGSSAAAMTSGSSSCGWATVPYAAVGINPLQEVQYNANFIHTGFSLEWFDTNWRLRGGYEYRYLQRDRIDAILLARNGVPQERNHELVGEVMRRVGKNSAIFMRGEYMRYQFVGEIPLGYNTMTAHRFDHTYGIASLGILLGF